MKKVAKKNAKKTTKNGPKKVVKKPAKKASKPKKAAKPPKKAKKKAAKPNFVADYLKEGKKCLKCGSSNLGFYEWDNQDDSAHRLVKCLDCETHFTEDYALVGFTVL